MTPAGMIPQMNSGNASSVYNNLTNSGAAPNSDGGTQAPAEMSPADSAISAIAPVLQLFQQVSSAFPNADEAKKQAVLQAITDYMQSVVGSLNSGNPANSGGLASTNNGY